MNSRSIDNKSPRLPEIPQILIVDDISMNVEIMKEIILSEGYEALCATSVQEAVEIMKKAMPSLILSDLAMPEVDGLQFCRMVKSNPKTRDIPFIFISVLDTAEEKERAFVAGAADFIPKPFDRVEVIMRVNNYLRAYQMQQEMEKFNRMMYKLVEEQNRQIEKEQKHMLSALSKVLEKIRGNEGNHIGNVAYNCRLLAQSIQFLPGYEDKITDEFIEIIGTAAKVHEIGSVLPGKDGTRDIEEQTEQAVKLLEEIGGEQQNSQFLSMAIRIVQYRYAHWDGTGHLPLKGKDIPLEAQIVALLDDFDSLTGQGCYLESPKAKEGLKIINDRSGTFYNPKLVEVFNKIWRHMRMS